MRLPWRRATGRHTAGPAVRAVATRPVVPAPRAVPPAPAAPPAAAVRLEFADGSGVSLPPEDPTATALRAVADLLVKTGDAAPTTNGDDPVDPAPNNARNSPHWRAP